MGEGTKIEWTRTVCAHCGPLAGHTYNIVIGCSKVSPACQFCYAEAMAKFRGWAKWGRRTARKIMSAGYWRRPLTWNYKAEQCPDPSHRPKVFCSSLADVFEDHPTVTEQRARLWPLIRQTPRLDWLLLTKRPERILESLPEDWGMGYPNVWLGTTCENQEWADKRIPHLLAVPAVVRFLSVEPMLGPVDLSRHLPDTSGAYRALSRFYGPNGFDETGSQPERSGPRGVDWVICGGESGGGARPMHPDWARALRDQCAAAEVPYHFKQFGSWTAFYDRDRDDPDWRNVPKTGERVRFVNLAGGHGFHGDRVVAVRRVAKAIAGRELDGRTWDEVPTTAEAR